MGTTHGHRGCKLCLATQFATVLQWKCQPDLKSTMVLVGTILLRVHCLCIGNLNADILLICNPIILHYYRDWEIAALEAVMDDSRRPDIIVNDKTGGGE